MRFEETQLWEIVIPQEKVFYHDWHKLISNLVSGSLCYVNNKKGFWNMNSEDCNIYRIACSEVVMKRICEITAKEYGEECVMCYRISNHCLLGYKDET